MSIALCLPGSSLRPNWRAASKVGAEPSELGRRGLSSQLRERLPLGWCCLRGLNGSTYLVGQERAPGGSGCQSGPSGVACWGWSHWSTAVGVDHCSMREQSPLGRRCPRGPNDTTHCIKLECAPGGSSCQSCQGGAAWRGLSHQSGAVGVDKASCMSACQGGVVAQGAPMASLGHLAVSLWSVRQGVQVAKHKTFLAVSRGGVEPSERGRGC